MAALSVNPHMQSFLANNVTNLSLNESGIQKQLHDDTIFDNDMQFDQNFFEAPADYQQD